jgi:hypothetical protein
MQDQDIASAIFKKGVAEQIGRLAMQVLEEQAKYQTLHMQFQAAIAKIDELQKQVESLGSADAPEAETEQGDG